MIDQDAVNSALTWTLGGSGAVMGAAFAFRKLFSHWISLGAEAKTSAAGAKIIEAAASANAAGSSAVNAVYETLTKEVTRLAVTNQTLTGEVSRLHEEINYLRAENLHLREEVSKLHAQFDRIARLYSSCETCPANERKSQVRAETINVLTGQ